MKIVDGLHRIGRNPDATERFAPELVGFSDGSAGMNPDTRPAGHCENVDSKTAVTGRRTTRPEAGFGMCVVV